MDPIASSQEPYQLQRHLPPLVVIDSVPKLESPCTSSYQSLDDGADTNSQDGVCCLARRRRVAPLGLVALTMLVLAATGGIVWVAKRGGHHSRASTPPAPSLSELVTSLRNGQMPVRGVNLGGWLVAEHWTTWDSPVWQDVPEEIAKQGEYKTMEFLGHDQGDLRFQRHRDSWITEQDIKEIAQFGLNTVRVPVGFWIVGFDKTDSSNNNQWQMYAPGALAFLDRLINEWSPKYSVAVMLSLHAHKGSQNGADHSAPMAADQHDWHLYPENMENSVQFATFLANRYRDAAGFLGMNLMNEPTAPTSMTRVQEYYEKAYKQIRTAGNECVLGVSPSLQRQHEAGEMQDFMPPPAFHHVWQEWHPYFVWGDEGKDESQLLDQVHQYSDVLRSWRGNWVFLGEWSLGSPASAPFDGFDRKREFAKAQMEAFALAHSGWCFWSWRHSDDGHGMSTGWSMRQNLRNGQIQPSWMK